MIRFEAVIQHVVDSGFNTSGEVTLYLGGGRLKNPISNKNKLRSCKPIKNPFTEHSMQTHSFMEGGVYLSHLKL